MQAAKLGKTVIIIDKGLILEAPRSTLERSRPIFTKAIIDLTDFYERSFYGKDRPQKNISINDLNYRLNKVLDEQRKMLLKQFEKIILNLFLESHGLSIPNHLAVLDKEDRVLYKVRGDFFLIASGSQPAILSMFLLTMK